MDCAQLPSRLRLCDPMDYSLPGSSAHGDSPGKNTGKGCHALLQGIFPTQGSNPSILQCRWIPSHLSHQGSFLKGAQTEAQNSTLSPLGSHNHQHGVGIWAQPWRCSAYALLSGGRLLHLIGIHWIWKIEYDIQDLFKYQSLQKTLTNSPMLSS